MKTTNTALIEEFAADAEIAKNQARGASGAARAPSIELKLGVLPEAQRTIMRKALGLVKRALKISNAGDHRGGAKYALKALDLAPEAAMPNHAVGLLLFRLGRLSRALEFYERAWKADPDDAEIYLNMGIVAWKLDMLDAAETFCRLCIKIDPQSVDGTINLASILRDQGRYDDAIEILRMEIYKQPEAIELWNSLGTVLSDSGDPEAARPFYDEALRIKPDFSRAHNNIANIYEMIGQPLKAIEHFDLALRNPQDAVDRATMTHGRSMALLASGQLEAGWLAQQSRLNPDNMQATLFSLTPPRWESLDLADVRGKRVLMVGEQGLGDEILFLNSGQEFIDAIGPDGQLHIACEKRLIPLIARSFPDAIVNFHVSAVVEGRNVRAAPHMDKNVDLWTPMGDPLGVLRPTHESFPTTPAFLTPDPERVAEFRAELDALGPKLKVGMLWKSLKMSGKRHQYFSPLDAWKSILDTEGVQFINMQYGDTEEDLDYLKNTMGVDIYTPKNLDLRDDLDGVAAMGVALDLTIGHMNASLNLAGSCGGEIWVVNENRQHWTILNADKLLWYPSSRYFWGKHYADWDYVMNKLGLALKERVASG